MAGTKTWADGDVLTAADLNGYVRDQWITICTSGTRPTTTQEGRTIYETDTDRYYYWDGAAWQLASPVGAWSTFTPTWNNVTLGSPGQVSTGRYLKVGKTCWIAASFTLGTGGSVTGTITLSNLPATASASAPYQALTAMFATSTAAGAGSTYVQASGTGTGNMYSNTTAVTTGVPGTWASGSWLVVSGCYETT